MKPPTRFSGTLLALGEDRVSLNEMNACFFILAHRKDGTPRLSGMISGWEIFTTSPDDLEVGGSIVHLKIKDMVGLRKSRSRVCFQRFLDNFLFTLKLVEMMQFNLNEYFSKGVVQLPPR